MKFMVSIATAIPDKLSEIFHGVCRLYGNRSCGLVATLIAITFPMSLFSQTQSDSGIDQSSNRGDDNRVVVSGKRNFEFRLLERQVELLKSYRPILSELNLSESQMEDIREFLTEYQRTINEMARESSRLKNVDRARKTLEFHQAIDGKLREILISHQYERLQQLGLQSFGSAQGQEILPFINMLGNPDFRNYVGVSSATAQKMRLKMQEENRKLSEETARLKKIAEDAVLSEMPEEDRNRLFKLFGEPFSFGKMEQSLGSRLQNSEDK